VTSDIPLDMKFFQFLGAVALLAFSLTVHAQSDPEAVDFGGESWGLSPDGEETFFDTAYVELSYVDEVHLLVPSFASDVEPDTPLDAPIDSVVIVAVLLVDTISGDTLTFEEIGMEYVCNNLGDCTDPCTFLGGGQYCASFSGVPNQTGEYVLSMEVNVWATVFGFPLATPFSFDGFPFPILGESTNVGEALSFAPSLFPNPASGSFTVMGAQGADAALHSMDGRSIRQWPVLSNAEQVDVANLTEGIYFLTLTDQGAGEVIRLVVQR